MSGGSMMEQVAEEFFRMKRLQRLLPRPLFRLYLLWRYRWGMVAQALEAAKTDPEKTP